MDGIKIVAGFFVMLVVAMSVFAGYVVAQSSGIIKSERVGVVGVEGKDSNKVTKYIYGSHDVSQETLEKYITHCSSLGGVFSLCGNYCSEGEVCPAVCVYTCENVRIGEDGISKIVDEESRVRVDYRTDENGYTIKYEGSYDVDSNVKVRTVRGDEIVVTTADGSEATVKVRPEQAVTNAFGASVKTESVKIELEEKNYNNVPAVVYKIESEHNGKFLGLFKIRARYDASVDAETGDVLDWNGPWWAFMITADGDSREPTRPVVKDKINTEREGGGNTIRNNNDGIQSRAGFGGGSGRPTKNNEGYSSRDLTPEECSKIGGTRETKCIGGDGPCMTYCDLSKVSNAEEKCVRINGRWSVAGDGQGACTIFWKMKQVIDFESCVAAGNSVMESYPGQCRHGDVVFVEIVGDDLSLLEKQCNSLGGIWRTGQTGGWFCNEPTKDVGKSCTDNNQCETVCFAPDSAVIGQKNIVGKCYGYEVWGYECKSQIVYGVVSHVACA